MTRMLSMSWVVAALACGSVNDRQACSVSTDCPVGQYCAHAGGESRCWADAVPPVVGAVTAACGATPCLRDGVLHVTASIADDAEVLDASVSLDLPGGGPVPMAWNGTAWAADVQLRSFPFPFYARNVTASVTAHDGARNASLPGSASGVGVTRLRWMYDAGAPITSPGVMSDGTVVVGVSAFSGQVLAVGADGNKRWSRTAGVTAFATAAPAIGDLAIWVGSEDGWLYAVDVSGSALKVGVGVNTGGAIRGSVAVLPGTGKEWAFATSNAGAIGAASTAGDTAAATPTTTFSVGPVIGLDGRAYAVTASGSIHAYRLTVSPVINLAEAWLSPVNVGGGVAAPLAVDAAGSVWTATVDGKLAKTVPADASGTLTPVATVSGWIVGSPVLLANGDAIVGDINGLLHRVSPSGVELWTPAINLGATVEGPIVLTGGDAALVVPAGGKIFGLNGDGSTAWSGTLDTGSLRAANIHTPPGQTANVTSTAYLASSSGKLYAVIVDGQLDAAAPWPKAFHDPRNTNRAGPQP